MCDVCKWATCICNWAHLNLLCLANQNLFGRWRNLHKCHLTFFAIPIFTHLKELNREMNTKSPSNYSWSIIQPHFSIHKMLLKNFSLLSKLQSTWWRVIVGRSFFSLTLLHSLILSLVFPQFSTYFLFLHVLESRWWR